MPFPFPEKTHMHTHRETQTHTYIHTQGDTDTYTHTCTYTHSHTHGRHRSNNRRKRKRRNWMLRVVSPHSVSQDTLQQGHCIHGIPKQGGASTQHSVNGVHFWPFLSVGASQNWRELCCCRCSGCPYLYSCRSHALIYRSAKRERDGSSQQPFQAEESRRGLWGQGFASLYPLCCRFFVPVPVFCVLCVCVNVVRHKTQYCHSLSFAHWPPASMCRICCFFDRQRVCVDPHHHHPVVMRMDVFCVCWSCVLGGIVKGVHAQHRNMHSSYPGSILGGASCL